MRKKTGRALAVFLTHLAQSEKAGLPLRQTLDAACKDADDAAMAKIAASMAQSVKSGKTLGEAMALHPALFDPAISGLVLAGEKAGRLALALQKCHDLVRRRLERQSEFARSTLGPKISLAIILSLAVFRQGPDALATLAFVAAFFFAVMLGRRFAPSLRQLTDMLVMLVPSIGGAVRGHNTARYCESLAVLHAGGLGLRQSLHLASMSVPNLVLQQQTREALLLVEAGASLHDAFSAATRFDAFALGLIRAGEESGNLAKTLEETAAYYDRQTAEAVTAIQQTAVPALVIVAGIILYMHLKDSGF